MTFRKAVEESPVTWFWANGDAWGTVTQARDDGGLRVRVTVLSGRVALRTIVVTGHGSHDTGDLDLCSGETLEADIQLSAASLTSGQG